MSERGIKFKNGDTKTQQHHKDRCNVNNIVERAKRGQLPIFNNKVPIYLDMYNVPNYKDAFDIVIEARNKFNQLPAALRKRFQNNPIMLLDFLSDENNRQEAIELGLVPEPKKPVRLVGEKVSISEEPEKGSKEKPKAEEKGEE